MLFNLVKWCANFPSRKIPLTSSGPINYVSHGHSYASYFTRSFCYSSLFRFSMNYVPHHSIIFLPSRRYHSTAFRSTFTIGRFLLGTSGAVVGFVTYKVTEWSNWISDKSSSSVQFALVKMFDLADALSSLELPSFDHWLPSMPNWQKKERKAFSLSDEILVEKTNPLPLDEAKNENVATGSSFPSPSISSPTQSTSNFINLQDDFKFFIKRMIEIKQMLKSTHYQDLLKLPSIVVIGSQSSGKSSVLECIVGHEFLPKGANMVTRRPLELTLVNTPNISQDYAIFTNINEAMHSNTTSGPIYDFGLVQQKLHELNMTVSENECISDNPIDLVIYSPNVPDLTLIDLPGYIQISNRHQPSELREKISTLCQKYIQEPNIILAISAADVDLANSESLKASRLVDPLGKRTVGVITKMDLVDPQYGTALLTNKDYPLHLGYVGVVCKKQNQSSTASRFFSGFTHNEGHQSQALTESLFFQKPGSCYQHLIPHLGISSLRKTLMGALEKEMYANLDTIHDNVQDELAELEHQLKVQYNDEYISLDSYISRMTDKMKEHCRELVKKFSRSEVRNKVQTALEGKLIDVYERYFWSSDQNKSGLAEEDIQYDTKIGHAIVPFEFNEKLEKAISALTKSSIGRLSTSLISEQILEQMKSLSYAEPFRYHPQTMQSLLNMTEALLKNKMNVIVNQIENAVKPFKYGTEFSPREWRAARESSIQLMKQHLENAEMELSNIQKDIGGKRLKQLIRLLDSVNIPKETGSHTQKSANMVDEMQLKNPYLIQKAKEAVRWESQIKKIQERLTLLQGSRCLDPYSVEELKKSSGSWWGLSSLSSWINPWSYWSSSDFTKKNASALEVGNPLYRPSLKVKPGYEKNELYDEESLTIWTDPCQYSCPEIYLRLLLNRLVSTTVIYLHYELVHNFLVSFPDMISASLTQSFAPNINSPNGLENNCDRSKMIVLSNIHSSSMNTTLLPLGWDQEQLLAFIRENPEIDAQLKLQARKNTIQQIYEKLALLKLTKNSNLSGTLN